MKRHRIGRLVALYPLMAVGLLIAVLGDVSGHKLVVRATAQENAQADTVSTQGRVSALPVPRFVSLRTEPINMRTGPGIRYPVTWVYQRRTLPVEITDEFDTWRRIRDPDGAEGWVHQSMLSGQRTGVFKGPLSSPLYKGSTLSSAVIAQLSPGVVLTVDRCPRQVDFCLVEAGDKKGWLQRGLFWGLYEDEIIE